MAFGAVPAAAGTLALGDRTFKLPELTPTDSIEGGCILIPGDRQGAGAVVTLSVSDNVNLGVLGEISRAVGAGEFEAHAECHAPCHAF